MTKKKAEPKKKAEEKKEAALGFHLLMHGEPVIHDNILDSCEDLLTPSDAEQNVGIWPR